MKLTFAEMKQLGWIPANPDTPEMRQSIMDRSKFKSKKNLLTLAGLTRTTPLPIYDVRVVDISYWQNPADIDYDLLCSQVDGFILRAVYSVWKDTFFDAHFNNIIARGKPIGAYHYIVGNQSPLLQAQAFRDAIEDKELQLGTHIDVEDTRPGTALNRQIVDSYAENLSIVHGKAKTIYTGHYAWQVIMNGADYTDYDLWVANYGVTQPAIPQQWTSWKLWQYTSSEVLPGYADRLDVSYFDGSKAAYRDWLDGVVEPPNTDPLYEVEVICTGLNIRKCPSTDCAVLYAVPRGTILPVYEEAGLWLRVGTDKYCSGNSIYVKRIEPPVVEPSDKEKLDLLWAAHPELH